ncbi:MAG: proprotein convertase P-domain-containing protein [Chitinophagaceae bacterium]|nr:proprotein convertase P-domain-containing protein [Chitinophagaceae bacterium]
MKKIYFFLFSLLLISGKAALSQCTNTTQFPGATIAINPTGAVTTISTCSFGGEFSVISGAVNGQTLRFTSSVATDFITIRSGSSSGPVLASGLTPLVFANTFTGTIYAHWNTSAACGSQATCRTTTVQCTSCTPPPPPVNDLCAGALPLNCGQTITGSTASATTDAVATCITTLNTAPGVWYTFAGDGSTTTINTCGSGYDTKLGVFSGSCGALTCVTGNDDNAACGAGSLQSQVQFTANVGTTYYVLVTGFNTASGNFTLNRTCVFPCSGVPSPGSISGPSATICAGTNVTLTLTGFTTGVTGISFQWKSSPTSGGPYTNIAGATNSTYTGAAGVNRFYVCTVTCANGGGNATTAEFALNVNRPVHSNVLATPATGCAPLATNITGTVSGGVTTGGVGVLASSGAINLAIPDNNIAGVNTTLTLPSGTNFAAAGDLRVRINARHSWVGDLIFTLTSPCGTTFLFDRPGVPPGAAGNSDNLGTTNATTPPPAVYTFDLAGATVIPETNVGPGFIAAGTYRPSNTAGAAHNWAGFTFPCNGAGTWTLNISDRAGADLGELVDWSILGVTAGNYTHALTGPGTIVQNPPTGPNNSNASFNVTNLPAGTHNFNLTSTDVTGCSVTTPVTVTVNPIPAVTIIPGGTVTTVSYTGPAVAVPDNTPAGVNIPLNVTGLTGTITDVNFRFDTDPAGTCNATVGNTSSAMNHTFIGDLIFRLTSPTATTVNVMNRRGGTRENICATLLDDDGGFPSLATVTSVTGQFLSGNFAPDNPLSAFDGVSPNGNWNLNVSDNAGIDVGSMRRFSLIISTASPTTFCAGTIMQLGTTVTPAGLVVFSPITDLYTDAAATIPYTGTPVSVVWAKPTVTRTYTATSTSAAGCVGSSSITLTVNQLPAITSQPAALAAPVCPGFNVTYSVGATGTGLTYQWQISTDGGTTYTNLASAPPYFGTTTANLLITNVTTAMTNYRFRVVVSGVCAPSQTSNAVTLVVATPPTITTNPANVTICAGANASFTVAATGIPAPTIYQWQISTDGGATWTNLTTGGSFTPTYTITAATTALNNTRYRCIVTNSCGQNVTSGTATLTVNALPTVTVTSLSSTRICISDTLVPLSGLPVGGSWSGIGVSGFNFVPAATAVGTYTLTYTYTNAAGCTASATTTARVEDCPERMRLLSENGVLLYPNPNSGQFFIKMNSTLYNYVGMRVYNSVGQVVNGSVVNDAVSSPVYSGLVYGRVIPVDLTNLPSGTYMVKVYYDDGVRTSEKTFPVVIAK